MNRSLFVYGTLLFPEIREALLQKKVKSRNALLYDYAAHRILYGQHKSEYPFLKQSAGSWVHGQILTPLGEHDLNLIKYYEGSEYELTQISVQISGADKQVQTFMPKEPEKIEFGPEWTPEEFTRGYLDKYLNNVIPQLLIDYNS